MVSGQPAVTAAASSGDLGAALDADTGSGAGAQLHEPAGMPASQARQIHARSIVGMTAVPRNQMDEQHEVVAVIPDWPRSDRDEWLPGGHKAVLANGQVIDPVDLRFSDEDSVAIRERFAANAMDQSFGKRGSVTVEDFEARHPETGYFNHAGSDGYESEIEELAGMRDRTVGRIIKHEATISPPDDHSTSANGTPGAGSRSMHPDLLDGSSYRQRLNSAIDLTDRLGTCIETAHDTRLPGVADRLAEAHGHDMATDGKSADELRGYIKSVLLPARTNYCSFGGQS